MCNLYLQISSTNSFNLDFHRNRSRAGLRARDSPSPIFSESRYSISTQKQSCASFSGPVSYKQQGPRSHLLLGEMLVHLNLISPGHSLIGGPRVKEKAFQSDHLHQKNARKSSNGDRGMRSTRSGGLWSTARSTKA